MQKGKLIEQITTIIEETAQGSDSVKVSHDVQLTDKYGNSRQIDVLIEYKENNRFTFKTIIECKYKGRDGVEINQMNAFLAMLQSLPNIHQGIFVSTSGFQKSAKIVAKENNIIMYTLEQFTKSKLEELFNSTPSIRRSEKKFEIRNWRILIDRENKDLLNGVDIMNVSPDQILEKDNIKIPVRAIVSEIVPYLANREFNYLFEKSISGEKITDKKFNKIFVVPLQTNFITKFSDIEIPVAFIEIELEFWISYSEELFETVNIYKDESDKELSLVVLGKVTYDDNEMFLSLVHDVELNKTEFYLIDGKNKKVKLEIDKEINNSQGNKRHFIVKKPKI